MMERVEVEFKDDDARVFQPIFTKDGKIKCVKIGDEVFMAGFEVVDFNEDGEDLPRGKEELYYSLFNLSHIKFIRLIDEAKATDDDKFPPLSFRIAKDYTDIQ